MHWILLLIGLPFGIATFRLGEKLVKRLNPKSDVVAALLYLTPLVIFCVAVIAIDIL